MKIKINLSLSLNCSTFNHDLKSLLLKCGTGNFSSSILSFYVKSCLVLLGVIGDLRSQYSLTCGHSSDL